MQTLVYLLMYKTQNSITFRRQFLLYTDTLWFSYMKYKDQEQDLITITKTKFNKVTKFQYIFRWRCPFPQSLMYLILNAQMKVP